MIILVRHKCTIKIQELIFYSSMNSVDFRHDKIGELILNKS